MIPPDPGARLLLGAIAGAERHPLVLPFGHRHANGHFRQLGRLPFERLDVDELEQLQAVQRALALAHRAPREDVTRLEGEQAADDIVVDACLTGDLDRSEVRQRAGIGLERHAASARTGIVLAERHLRVRVAMVAQLVQRPLPHGQQQLAIERTVDAQAHGLGKPPAIGLRQDVETAELDTGNPDRFAFRNVDGDRHPVLGVVEDDIEGADACLRKPAIAIERLDPLQVGFKRPAVEEVLAAPRNPGAFTRLEHPFERVGVDLLDAVKVEAGDLHVALFPASTADGNGKTQNGNQRAHGGHAVCPLPHAVPDGVVMGGRMDQLRVLTPGALDVTASMMPKPTAITAPMATQTPGSSARMPDCQSAHAAPSSSTK